ncbi:hypothetical protein ILYODFUR_023216, partial [Ilyodon furcidens]
DGLPLNMLEGFECLNDPRGYVVWGLNAPGRVSHAQQALGDGSDKDTFTRTTQSRQVTSPGTVESGSGLVGERLVPPCRTRLGQAQTGGARPSPSGPHHLQGQPRGTSAKRIGQQTKVETSAA